MLSIGIVGLPNVGKSTLFNALTESNILAANYPFATIEPNTGIVPVPDKRVHKLGQLFEAAKVVPATVTFVDIAGIVAGAHKGEGMGNAFLSHIRETDAIVQVVRAFDDDDIQHVHNQVHPQNDIEVINTELVLADLQSIDHHLPKVQKLAKSDPKQRPLLAQLEKARGILDAGQLLAQADDQSLLADLSYLNLLSAKPFIFVFNLDENELADTEKHKKLRDLVAPAQAVFVCAKLEAEIAQLQGEDRQMFMDEYGLEQSGLERLSAVGYQTLGLQSFLTAGPKEAKAWTIPQGATAPRAAGVIHTDFEKGFIAAEIASYDDLLVAGSRTKARELGKLRTEGRDYIMQDGDVVEFRFNV